MGEYSRRRMIRLKSYLILFIMLTVFYAAESERIRAEMNLFSERTAVRAADALSDEIAGIMTVLENIINTGNGDLSDMSRRAEKAIEYACNCGIGEDCSENLSAYFHKIISLENEKIESIIADSKELYKYGSSVYSWLELLASKNYDAENAKLSVEFPEYPDLDTTASAGYSGSSEKIRSVLESSVTERYNGVNAARYADKILGNNLILKEMKGGSDFTKIYYCSNAYVEFTEYGGYLVRMLRERIPSESRYSDSECASAALDFANLYGYNLLSEKSREYSDGAIIFEMTVPDGAGAIKVGVSRYDRSVFMFCAADMLEYQKDIKAALAAHVS